MQCQILKSFPFSRDGVTTVVAAAGSETDVPDTLVPGLEGEGYVRRSTERKALSGAPETQALAAAPENKAAEAAPEGGAFQLAIPEDWRDLSWPSLRSLASQVSADPIHSKNDAVAAIEAEVERRG